MKKIGAEEDKKEMKKKKKKKKDEKSQFSNPYNFKTTDPSWWNLVWMLLSLDDKSYTSYGYPTGHPAQVPAGPIGFLHRITTGSVGCLTKFIGLLQDPQDVLPNL